MIKPQPLILFSAGGTGGHIFPALAIANELKDNYRLLWVGGSYGLEQQIVPKYNIELQAIDMYALRGKGKSRYLAMPFILIKACYQSYKLLRKYKPSIIITFGGYVTVPIAIMGYFLKIPLIIHEQNSVAGLANKLLARIAKHVLVAFPRVLEGSKTKLVGNPVRPELMQIAKPDIRYSQRSSGLNILIIGGSLGARVFNESLPIALAKLTNIDKITHQIGRSANIMHVKELYNQTKAKVEVVNFIDDMLSAYSEADLVICRAGASTIAELTCVGVASILVPYPYASDNHQQTNTSNLVANYAAHLVLQTPNISHDISKIIGSLTRDDCLTMAIKAYSLGIADTKEQICAIIKHNIIG